MSKSFSDAQIRSRFRQDHYAELGSLIAPDFAARLYDHVTGRSEGVSGTGSKLTGLDDVAEGYADPLMEHLLRGVLPRIEILTGLELSPTYSFFRLYRRGSVLPPHQDREACEIGVSVHLGQSGNQPWPLWVEGPNGQSAADLKPGEALIYRGIECEHWREALTENQYAQIFLHYVDKNGPYREWRFDKRSSLGVGGPTPAQ
jgi:hypothetical protein